jgi:hypothetical protein
MLLAVRRLKMNFAADTNFQSSVFSYQCFVIDSQSGYRTYIVREYRQFGHDKNFRMVVNGFGGGLY